jgi:hypothetical protein
MSISAAERTPVIVYSDAPASLYDTIIFNGAVVQMIAGTTVVFSVRPLASRAASISNAAVAIYPTDTDGHNVRYDWQPSDILTLGEGDFMAWWTFTLPSSSAMDSPEFPLLITDHGPGTGTKTGAIVAGVTAFMPVTLSALQNDDRYGDLWLQQQAEVIKLRTMGTTVSPDSEQDLGVVFIDYLSKRLAFHLTTPGIEYWSRQWRTTTSTQTSEVASYPDMIASLRQLRQRLVHELAQEWRDLMAIQPGLAMRHVMPLPATTLGDPTNPHNGYISRNPRSNDPLYTGGRGFGLEYGVYPFP